MVENRKMIKNLLSALPFLIMPFFMLSTLTDANPLAIACSNVSFYNSAFEKNLNLLLKSLPSNISKGHFYNFSVGDDPDRVFGRALCRGDVNNTVCQNCLENARQEILKKCKTVEAVIWYELCQIQYSYQKFSMMVYAGQFPDWNTQQKRVSNPTDFNEVLMYLMNNLSIEAASNLSKGMFAAGEIKSSKSKTIYGLVQCTGDISNIDCSKCLTAALGDLNTCCGALQGGIVVNGNCNVRFQSSHFYNASSLSLTYPTSTGRNWKIGLVVAVTCISAFVLTLLIGSYVIYLWRKKRAQNDEVRSQQALLQKLARPTSVSLTKEGDFVSCEELPFMHLDVIRAATDEFSDSNKLGQGGFGTVYKGELPNGEEVSVKRLSRKSWQGLEEFKNEIILIARLQHRNLVRLLGCSIEGEEKLLIYEFMPNKSLDIFIFDSERRSQLNWKTCYNIISGIARGLVYLHEDSRLKIIHRDLKPSNVLLDKEMVAKISDFGMARIFCENQKTANTRRVVGSYGYMAPEYAMEGLFSVKSDVYSFGIILFEIISGQKNSGFHLTGHAPTLLAYAWQLWKEGKELEFVDPFLLESRKTSEVLKCIHIGLLCVQEDPAARPTMSTVVALLGNEAIALPEPRQPPFSAGRIIPSYQSSMNDPSVFDMTLSSVSPR